MCMPNQTVTRTLESDIEPDKLYSVVAKAGNITRWAPVFADAIEKISGTRHEVTKNGEVFVVEVLLHPSARAVDYIREMTEGRRGGAYIRVMPRPLGGSTIAMTVPLGLASESSVAKVLEQELADLVRIASA
jgi:hypothetical protein